MNAQLIAANLFALAIVAGLIALCVWAVVDVVRTSRANRRWKVELAKVQPLVDELRGKASAEWKAMHMARALGDRQEAALCHARYQSLSSGAECLQRAAMRRAGVR